MNRHTIGSRKFPSARNPMNTRNNYAAQAKYMIEPIKTFISVTIGNTPGAFSIS